ncbi:hypothetical protein KAU11_07295 [Candidatus Babeliales bacterium]|nr:hypothetical protein [Candidatus Babeliales bacterium]
MSDTEIQEDSEDETFEGNEYGEQEEQGQSSENVGSQIAASDFDPERVLYAIKKTLLGFENRDSKWVRVSEPLARTEFIMLYISSIRSLVNFHNMFSQISGDEAAFNMLESLKEITYACVDYGVKEEHIETLVNMYDTLKNSFYGIIIEGRGTENVKQVLTSVYKDLTESVKTQNQTGLINWDQVQNKLK